MIINRKTKTEIKLNFNSFKKIVKSREDREYVTIKGSLNEIIKYSNKNRVYVKRSASTEQLFPTWDKSSKYAVIRKQEVDFYADRKSDIYGYGWYIHEGVIA